MAVTQARDDYRPGSLKTKCRPTASLFWIAVITIFAGCSGSPSTYPVTGTVKLADGKPLAGARVLFQPTGEPSQPARAIIADDGTFKLGTFSPGDGAVPGHHKVAVYPKVGEDAGNNMAAVARYRAIIDSQFQNIQTTPLEYTVQADRSGNHFDIVVGATNGAKGKN